MRDGHLREISVAPELAPRSRSRLQWIGLTADPRPTLQHGCNSPARHLVEEHPVSGFSYSRQAEGVLVSKA